MSKNVKLFTLNFFRDLINLFLECSVVIQEFLIDLEASSFNNGSQIFTISEIVVAEKR